MHAFMLYINDWLSSPKIEMMDAAEERGYLRLLLRAAKEHDCGLPDDEAILAKLSLLGPQWFKPTADEASRIGDKTSGEKLRECFVRIDGRPGRIYNMRLLREWERHTEISEKRRELGKRGAAAKQLLKQKGSNCLSNSLSFAEANGKQTGQQNASTSTSTSTSKEENTLFVTTANAESKPKKAKASRKTPAHELTETELPVEWGNHARNKYGWTMQKCLDEFDRFSNHHRARGNLFSSWKAAWHMWCSNDGRFSGQGKQIDRPAVPNWPKLEVPKPPADWDPNATF